MKFSHILSIFLFVCFAQVAVAQCVSGDCQSGIGKYILPSGAVYEGQFKNGEVHGIGTCNYSDGSIYHGEWAYRFPHGKGSKLYPDKEIWTGQWNKGRPIDKRGRVFDETFISKSAHTYDYVDIQVGYGDHSTIPMAINMLATFTSILRKDTVLYITKTENWLEVSGTKENI